MYLTDQRLSRKHFSAGKPKPHPRRRDSPRSRLDPGDPWPQGDQGWTPNPEASVSVTMTNGEVDVAGHWSHRIAGGGTNTPSQQAKGVR